MERSLKIAIDVDRSGVTFAFLFGVVVGALLTYPALPRGVRVLNPDTFALDAGPVGGPLIGGTALFLLFVIGVVALNWLFINAGES